MPTQVNMKCKIFNTTSKEVNITIGSVKVVIAPKGIKLVDEGIGRDLQDLLPGLEYVYGVEDKSANNEKEKAKKEKALKAKKEKEKKEAEEKRKAEEATNKSNPEAKKAEEPKAKDKKDEK